MTQVDPISEISQQGATLIARIRIPKLSDQQHVERLKTELIEGLNGSSTKNVILDFQEVRFAGSIAFLAFLGLRRVPSVERIIVCNLDSNVREIFAICRLIPTGTIQNAPFEEAGTVPSALLLCDT